MSTSRTTRLCKIECSCGRIARVSKAVYEQGPIVCGLCGSAFEMSEKDEEAIKQVKGRWGSHGT